MLETVIEFSSTLLALPMLRKNLQLLLKPAPDRTLLLLMLWGLIGSLSPGTLPAQQGKHLDPLSWDRNIAALVRKNCLRCHDANQTEGGINLAQDVNPRLMLTHRQTWEKAREMLRNGSMPPPDESDLKEEDRQHLIDFLTQLFDSIDCSTVQDPGPPPFRRLNNVEYRNTIRDLTGLDIDPTVGFSPDPSSYGFDCIGETLMLSPVQVEQYHRAAQQVAKALLNTDGSGGTEWAPALRVGLPVDSAPRATAESVISSFATRAFRRPIEREYLDRLLTVYDVAIQHGETQDQALEHLITAVLVSPRFLVRLEAVHPDQNEPYPVDDYELASRLSYFLWSRPPDDTLLKLAAEGKLGELSTLEEQTRRMLADPRSRGLVDNFFGQWLELRRLATHVPDDKEFPEFSQAVRDAVLGEVQAQLSEIVQQNRPIRELIDADYTFLNEPLAKWYGVPKVAGNQLQRVSLPDRRRGGVLTSAAVLMAQSDPGRTNIPRRGNYIAGRILGDAPPPPPPDVPELSEPAAGDKPLTLRERLELHRQNAECASCHARIDPMGFSLENYDAVGRWRTEEAGQPIDAGGEMPDGRKIAGPEELKDLLLDREEAFQRTLVQNLLIYALGRSLQPEDECVVRDAVSVAQREEGRFGEIVVTIVKSYPFRYRRNPDY
ncbi:DUF1592 domain-containing protein [Planctomicrobium sp. SH664]|uniref:DUF1592 domain-containing protein n=1 Tax=Planctomicrobium sp. SH664 TaxID=3448125 RepID=UPI003F5C5F4F